MKKHIEFILQILHLDLNQNDQNLLLNFYKPFFKFRIDTGNN